MSAELNGIAAVLERYRPSEVMHLLVHTDTALGAATAGLVREALDGLAAPISAPGLRTDDLDAFRAALADLTRTLDETVAPYREQRWQIVFNLTGGFKALNGYLQALGMVAADRCVFLYEGAPQLMEIPRLPVRLAERDELRAHATLFRRLVVGYRVSSDEAAGVPESLLLALDGEVTTSVLGDLVWARHRAALLAERLHPPLSSRVRVADAVHKAFAALEPQQQVEVNDALDAFSAMTDGVRPLPKSRTFKPLAGHPFPDSTHELYAWNTVGAGRLLGHYDPAGGFVFDRLTGHL